MGVWSSFSQYTVQQWCLHHQYSTYSWDYSLVPWCNREILSSDGVLYHNSEDRLSLSLPSFGLRWFHDTLSDDIGGQERTACLDVTRDRAVGVVLGLIDLFFDFLLDGARRIAPRDRDGFISRFGLRMIQIIHIRNVDDLLNDWLIDCFWNLYHRMMNIHFHKLMNNIRKKTHRLIWLTYILIN